MNLFHTALSHVNKIVYEPNQLKISAIQKEEQNSKYGAGIFKLASKTVRFRVANTTPTKLGQFVACWEKNENNKNQPYSYEEAPDLLVITTFKNEHDFGQCIFPKETLLKQKILCKEIVKGKMALRVYPSWDSPISKQAIKTQEWQLPYVIDLTNPTNFSKEKLTALYLS